jgi:hypothetical protein
MCLWKNLILLREGPFAAIETNQLRFVENRKEIDDSQQIGNHEVTVEFACVFYQFVCGKTILWVEDNPETTIDAIQRRLFPDIVQSAFLGFFQHGVRLQKYQRLISVVNTEPIFVSALQHFRIVNEDTHHIVQYSVFSHILELKRAIAKNARIPGVKMFHSVQIIFLA